MNRAGSAPAVGESGIASELSELRELLLGPEWERLREVRERIHNRTLRAADVAEVLPDALLTRAQRDAQLRRVLQPVLEEALVASVRKDPRVLAEALFPMISGAIRRAVATALQGMVESLNQIVETSFTLRSVRWRIEALRTGKSYGEIALLRSLLYRVEQVFLIHRNTGLLLQHVIADAALVRDPDMVSAMLTAIQDFVRDSFGGGEHSLETLRVGEMTIWVQHGPEAILAGVVRGTPPFQLRNVFFSALERIQREYNSELAAFDGDATLLDGARPVLEACLVGRSPDRRSRMLLPVYIVLGLLLAAVIAWAAVWLRQERRWSEYVMKLQEEPGIALTTVGKSGGRYRIAGLRDPLARDPAAFLQAAGLAATEVEFDWKPYLSLSPPIRQRREALELTNAIEQQTIRFEAGRSSLTYAAVDAAETLASHVARLTEIAPGTATRLELTGHADERGPADLNARLGSERAREVAAVLASFGIDPAKLATRSAGAEEPVRPGTTEHHRSFNRSVTFRVLNPPQ